MVDSMEGSTAAMPPTMDSPLPATVPSLTMNVPQQYDGMIPGEATVSPQLSLYISLSLLTTIFCHHAFFSINKSSFVLRTYIRPTLADHHLIAPPLPRNNNLP